MQMTNFLSQSNQYLITAINCWKWVWCFWDYFCSIFGHLLPGSYFYWGHIVGARLGGGGGGGRERAGGWDGGSGPVAISYTSWNNLSNPIKCSYFLYVKQAMMNTCLRLMFHMIYTCLSFIINPRLHILIVSHFWKGLLHREHSPHLPGQKGCAE